MSRRKIIAGNWKMNVKPSETAALVKAVAEATKDFASVEVVCCTPAIDVPAAVAAAAGTQVGAGTANCRRECHGARTGEREAGKPNEAIERQMKVGLAGVTAADCAKLVIAYEPVWAIGTGKTATPDQAQEVHALIRATLAGLVGAETAETVRIQYGGSMKPSNAAELLAKKDIDGGLIGGAALKAADFAGIVAAANA